MVACQGGGGLVGFGEARSVLERRGRCMATIHFTANLARQTSAPTREVPGETVREVLEGVFREVPPLRGYVLDDQGTVRRHVTVFIDGTPIADRVGLTDPLRPDSEVHVLQALSGG